TARLRDRDNHVPPQNWVGDLMTECDVEVTQAQGELVLELRKGVRYYQARWDLFTGLCRLIGGGDDKEEQLESQETILKKPGKYLVRFANVDNRLIVWVNST